MKKQSILYPARKHRFLSMFLVVLFLSISILQLAHAHKVFPSDKENVTAESVSAVEKCEICDFIIHKQSKHVPADIPQQTIVLSPVKITYSCNSCICNYEFTLQGFTNKGPPIYYS
jgi:hypothetical protein